MNFEFNPIIWFQNSNEDLIIFGHKFNTNIIPDAPDGSINKIKLRHENLSYHKMTIL
jgi:hypothetical protein